MKRISRIAPVGVAVLALALGGSTLASAKGHHAHGHAKLADVLRDSTDVNKDGTDVALDQASAQKDVTTPDSPAEAQKEQADAQNEQADNQIEAQDAQKEGDDPAQALACKGLATDDVQYDEQTGTCIPETGNGSSGSAQDNGSSSGGSDTGSPGSGGVSGSTGGGRDNSQND